MTTTTTTTQQQHQQHQQQHNNNNNNNDTNTNKHLNSTLAHSIEVPELVLLPHKRGTQTSHNIQRHNDGLAEGRHTLVLPSAPRSTIRCPSHADNCECIMQSARGYDQAAHGKPTCRESLQRECNIAQHQQVSTSIDMIMCTHIRLHTLYLITKCPFIYFMSSNFQNTLYIGVQYTDLAYAEENALEYTLMRTTYAH